MRYISFEGAVLDTIYVLSQRIYNGVSEDDLTYNEYLKKVREFINNENWQSIILESKVINDSMYILKHMDPSKSSIVAKVYNVDNDGKEIVSFLRDNKVKQNIIFVPHGIQTTDIVSPVDNILVDRRMKPLDLWNDAGGYPMFLDVNDDNADLFGRPNKNNYQRVRRIDERIKR